MKKLLLYLFVFAASTIIAQKVAIVGLNHVSSPDGFTFVATENLNAGEVIYFTENEYDNTTHKFNDLTESVVKFTVTTAINKGNVVYVAETGVTTDTFTVTASSGAGTAVKTSSSSNFAIATLGETFYAYSDTDENPTNGVTEIYAVMYTGVSDSSGGNIPAIENPVPDFSNAILVHNFPASDPNRVEFKTSVADRTNVSKANLENTNNYLHGQAHQALSTTAFTNINLSGVNPVLTVNATGSPVAENSGSTITYTFSLNTAATSNITVNFSVGGSATFGTDYTQSGAASFNATSGTVVIANGTSSKSITITPTNEAILEPNETITLTATSGTGYDVGSPSIATGQINNDDTLNVTPLVAVTGINHTSTKGFSFVVLKDLSAGQTMYFTENSFINTDLSFTGAEAVVKWTVPTGGITRGKVVVVKETSANTYAVSCSTGTSCGTISHISGEFTPSIEGESFFAYTDADDNHTNGVTEVHSALVTGHSAVSGPGGAIANSENIALLYLGAVVVDNFPAVNPNRVEYNPSLRNSTVDQANFQSTANWLHAQANQDLSVTPFSSVIISEGATNPTVSVAVSPSSIEELATNNLTYTFTLSSTATQNIVVNFDVSGTATYTTDYTVTNANAFNSSTGSITIPNGSTTASITITPVADTEIEPEEEITLTLSSGSGYNGGSPHSATGKITNNDTNTNTSLIAILGINHETPDGFSFVAKENIAPNTTFYFTDNIFSNTSLSFTNTEAVIQYTSPNTCIAKGTVFTVKENTANNLILSCQSGSCGTVYLTGGFSISATGEAFYAYQDTDNNPSNGVLQIHGVLFTEGGNIPTENNPKNTYSNAVVTDGFPTTSPNKTEYKIANRNTEVTTALLEDISNWEHAQANIDLSSTNFTVQAIIPKTIYVNASITTSGDGSSWATAYKTIQEALASINLCTTDQIWVAAGTYKPINETTPINIPENTIIYGGFNGTETTADARNWNANPTIISGDLNSDNTANAGDAHTLLFMPNNGSTVDGFTFEYSFADDATTVADRTGGAIYNTGNNNTIDHCIFHNNIAQGNGSNGVGGAIISFTNTLNIINSLFYNNTATANGGAISAESGTLNLTNCTLANNTANNGGGIHFFNGTVVAVNSIFTNNSGTNGNINDGGGAGAGTANYCMFFNNTTANTGDLPTNITGANNILNTDPLYAAGYQLLQSSPAINVGDNTANSSAKDLGANNRVLFGTIDMGAYEGTTPPPFTELSTAGLTGVYSSSVAWGDYDNDGDLDILLTGHTGSTPIAKIYTNNAGTFTELSTASLPGVNSSSVAWGDYDNDGDLDILLTGHIGGGTYISKIYTNNAGTFTELSTASLPGVSNSSVAWGDYDNDGDLDILLTGYTGSTYISKIYTNNAGTFSELSTAGLTGVDYSSVAWADYDNDGDLDILLTGYTGSTHIAKIYTNNAGTFSELSTAGLTGVHSSSVAWGDYDNDGDLDILLTGHIGSTRISKIYTNNAGTFTELSTASLPGVSNSSVAWGDYDNDGDLDILLTGYTGSTYISKIYTNNAGTFTELSTASLPGVYRSAVAWGDYDNDGDLDILLTGRPGGSTGFSKIYTNNANTPNTAPTAPTNPTAMVNDTTVTLNWDAATDTQTPTSGLSYNIYIKENPVATPPYITSPMAQDGTAAGIQDGWRKLPALGNAQQNTTYTWKIPASYCGTSTSFTYKIQAIDHNYAASAFSTEGSFSINPSPKTLYVNATTTGGTADGSSWANAFNNLQDAIADAGICGDEIWVAAGTYKPADETSSFTSSNDLKIYGGFNGTETNLSERNWNANETILSGDLDNSNTANAGDSHTIFYNTESNVILDGFSIINSYADGTTVIQDSRGGAIYNTGADLKVNNCIFINNNAITTGGTEGIGGAISNNNNAIFITNSLFYNNHAGTHAGAIHSAFGTLNLTNVTIANNTASNVGGAIYAHNSDVAISNSILYNNSGTRGNIYVDGTATRTISYSALYNTTPGNDGTIPTDVTDGGNNLLSTDPLFTDEASNDYTLQSGSPLVEAGNNSANSSTKDLAGNDRIVDADQNATATIDMGAYERTPPPFTELSTANLPGVSSSSVAWGDYDNDGDLDILLTGYTGSTRTSKIYTNNAGTFTELSTAGLIGVSGSSVAWGDYDNDGDLDILLTGWTGSTPISKIYTNNAGTFTELSTASLPGVHRSSVAWGDYDNDGDLDILLTGRTGSTPISKIYTNNAGTFTELSTASLPGVYRSSVAWGDYDNDGDLDILLTGYTGSTRISKIYTNNAGTFTELSTANLTVVYDSSVAWGDYDNDGDLDILLTGSSGSTVVSKIYTNNAGTFTELSTANLTGVYNSSVAWGDYDNDGDLDILLTGWTGSTYISKIYTNNAGTFTELSTAGLTGVDYSSVAWADYDNDGDLDILLTGRPGASIGISKIYTNNANTPNTAPTAPANPTAMVNTATVTLNWDAATDTQTPTSGLSYNVYIKENPVATPPYITSPMAQDGTAAGIQDGWRKLPALGNAQQNTTYTWKIPASYCGTSTSFTYKIQAIDHNFAGSAFSAEGSFSINPSPKTLYVNATTTGGTGDGSSWANAFNNLQDAIAAAGICGDEIWVAAGTYKPADETSSFTSSNDLKIYGGFNGTETNLSERNWNANETILSGDLDNSNTANAGDSHTIFYNTESNVILDGFSIINSYADGTTVIQDSRGGAIYNTGSDLKVNNCIFRNNNAIATGGTEGIGGAISNNNNAIFITNSLFYNNHAVTHAGAIHSAFGTLNLTNVTIANNTASNVGGAIYAHNSDVAISNSILYNNSGTRGNIYVDGTATRTISYSALYNTTSGNDGTIPADVTDGGNNLLSTDPLFTDEASNDYTLQSGSPAVEAGNNSANSNTKDLAGDDRIVDADQNATATIDMGAYERTPPPFTELSTTNLPGVSSSSVAWGDYDNDGDLDILLTGYAGSTRISKIYTNNSGTFTELSTANLPGVNSSSVAWGDYDNDGDLDILLTGYAGSTYISKIYTNNAGNFTELITAGLTGVEYSSVAWGDYDNDGDLDILLTGHTGSTYISKIYTNNAGTFTELSTAGLTGVYGSSVAWGDYDNDGDLDILLTGYTGSTRIAKIYTNNAGTFTELSTAGLTGVTGSSVAWGDYDNDGDLDILLTGNTGSTVVSKIYTNNAGTFTELNTANLTVVYDSSVAWGDYDNDGDLDILLTGYTGSTGISKIYTNDGYGSFSELATANLTGVSSSSVAWGDYDNDGDLDILLTGYIGASTDISKIYTNTASTPNTAPTAPTNPTAMVNDTTVSLNWDAATDTQTPSNGLSYNIYIKESPVGNPTYVSSPMAQENNGWRKLPALGNAQQNTTYTWKIPASYCGTSTSFTYKIQAIDHNYAASAFSAEGSFSINPSPKTLYVNATTTGGTGDGSSWANAFNNLQDAIAAAGICGDEIWVAAGTYKPADETSSFTSSNDLKIYGGFNGTETNLSERNWNANETILSGDLDNSNTANAGDSHTIFYNTESNVILDGFSIINSYADGTTVIQDSRGGAIYNTGSDLKVNNCIFRNNNAIATGGTEGIGGAISNNNNAIFITNSLFYNNHAGTHAGAIHSAFGTLNLTNVTIANNTASNVGGAIYAHNSDVAISNSILYNNSGTRGNIYVDGAATRTISYSALYNTTPGNDGTIPTDVTDGGNNLLSTDPLFTDEASNDYTLQSGSPLVEVGNNSANSSTKDLAGDDRIVDADQNATATIDMGAYEFNGSDPTAVCQNITVPLDATGNATITATNVDGGSSDTDGTITLSIDISTFDCSDIGTNNVTLTVTDNNGNTDTCVAVVTVKDKLAPIVIAQNISVDLDASGNVNIVPADIDNGSSDNCSIKTIALDVTSFDCSNIGENTVTLAVTDVNGNTASKTAIVTVKDKLAPIVITQNISVDLDASGNVNIVPADIDNGSSDNCSIKTIALDVTSFDCSNIGENTVTLAVTDVNGNTASKTAIVTVKDKLAPIVITQNISVDLDASGNVNIVPADIDNGSSDNCSIKTIALDVTSFDCSNIGENTVTLTVTDVNGNTASKTAIVTVKDKLAPIVITRNISVDLDASGNANIVPADIDNGSSDNCSINTIALDVTSFDCTAVGENTVTLTVTDVNGNTASKTAIVTVKDKLAPIVITQNISVDLDASGNTNIVPADIDNGSSDNCSIKTITLDVTSFDCSNIGENTVTLTVTDVNGNTASKTAIVTVKDKLAPIVITQNISVDLDASGNTNIVPADIDNGSSDNCSIKTITLDVTSFDCSNIGENTVTLTVTDVNGNTASKAAIVTVKDKLAPIVITQNISVDLDASGNTNIVPADIDNGSSDNCSIKTITLDVTSFDCSNIGENTVTLTVTDVNGNTASKTAIVTVKDKLAPIVITQNISVDLDASGNANIVPADIDNGSSDNCSIKTITLDVTSFDCTFVGENAVTLTITDIHGNSAKSTATVTVVDTVMPVVSSVAPFTLALNDLGSASITAADIDNGSSDNCGITSMSIDVTSFDCSTVGENTITLTVTDGSGNSATSTTLVTIVDTIAPMLVTKNISVSLDEFGNATIVASDIIDDSFDACGIDSMSLDKTSFSCPTLGDNTVTLTVIDVNGNSASEMAIVTFIADDLDNDSIADVCDTDKDGDGVENDIDNCPTTANSDQRDLDRNGIGDVCDQSDLEIPKGFSPNGDGVNDEFIIKGLHKYSNNSIQIYNRNGNLVYESKAYQNYWDGVSSGKSRKLPAAPYFYVLSIDGGKRILKGWVYINY